MTQFLKHAGNVLPYTPNRFWDIGSVLKYQETSDGFTQPLVDKYALRRTRFPSFVVPNANEKVTYGATDGNAAAVGGRCEEPDLTTLPLQMLPQTTRASTNGLCSSEGHLKNPRSGHL